MASHQITTARDSSQPIKARDCGHLLLPATLHNCRVAFCHANMNYNDYYNKIGIKYNIVLGKLVEDTEGTITVSDNFTASNIIYVNHANKTANLVIAKEEYVGRSYALRKNDCISLIAEWLTNNTNKDFNKVYSKISNKVFMEYYKKGIDIWFEENGFTQVTTPILGDCLVYAYKPDVISHAGIYIQQDKILHHIPYLLSSIDSIDAEKLLKVYRYGN